MCIVFVAIAAALDDCRSTAGKGGALHARSVAKGVQWNGTTYAVLYAYDGNGTGRGCAQSPMLIHDTSSGPGLALESSKEGWKVIAPPGVEFPFPTDAGVYFLTPQNHKVVRLAAAWSEGLCDDSEMLGEYVVNLLRALNDKNGRVHEESHP